MDNHYNTPMQAKKRADKINKEANICQQSMDSKYSGTRPSRTSSHDQSFFKAAKAVQGFTHKKSFQSGSNG